MSEVAVGSGRVNVGHLAGRSPRLLLALMAIVAAMLFFGPRAEAAIYWTNGSEGTIGRAESDGTLAEQDFITGLETPRAVAIDGEHIYWTDLGTESIGRANLDGTDVEPEFVPNVGDAFGLAVYGEHIYWTTRSTESIGRANLDGSGVADEFIGGRLLPSALIIDAEGIFWTEAVEVGEEEFEYLIATAPLAGGPVSPLPPSIASLPYGLAHDADGFFWSISAFQTIASSNPEATSWSNAYIEEVSGPEGLAVDPEYLYWAAAGSNSIGRENLATETVEHEFIPTGERPRAVAVTTEPIVKATPTISVTSSGTVPLGGKVDATASLAGGRSPAGTIEFELFGPGDEACAGVPVTTSAATTGAPGEFSSADFTPTAAGTYTWVALYSGDGRNKAVRSSCSDPAAKVVITTTPTTPDAPGTTTRGVSAGASAPQSVAPTSAALRLVKVSRSKARGTGAARFRTPAAGTLTVSGKGVKRRSAKASAAGYVTLRLIPKGGFRNRLSHHRRGFTRLKVTFRPAAGGPAITQMRRVRLVHR